MEKLNHAKFKRELAERYCKMCEERSHIPSCIAAIIPEDIKEFLWEEAERAIEKGYRFSKSACPWPAAYIASTKQIFETAVEKLFIQRNWSK